MDVVPHDALRQLDNVGGLCLLRRCPRHGESETLVEILLHDGLACPGGPAKAVMPLLGDGEPDVLARGDVVEVDLGVAEVDLGAPHPVDMALGPLLLLLLSLSRIESQI